MPGRRPKAVKVAKKVKLKNASTQTDRYVEHMPLPIIVDIKSENESSNEESCDNAEPAIAMFETLKVEIDDTNHFDDLLSEAYLPPVEEVYFEDKSSIINLQPVIVLEKPLILPKPSKSAETQAKLKEKTPRKNQPKPPKRKDISSTNGTKKNKPRKQKATLVIREAAPPATRIVECNLCKFTCKRPSHLKRHMLTHTGEKPHQCEFCPKRFAQKTDLNRHMSCHAVHYDFHCGSCGRGFADEATSKKHESNCRTKRYACDQCDHVTFSIGNLHLHMRKHTGERPFACEVCDKRFTRVSHLNQHIKLHAEDFDLHCSNCGRGFDDAERMQKHQITCRNRQFQCHMCRDTHHRMDNLKRHIKITHMGEREVMCEFCSKQFPAKSSLRKHIQHRHPERL